MKGRSTVALMLVLTLIAIGAIAYFIMQFYDKNPTQSQPSSYMTGVIVDMNNTSILVVGDLSVEEVKSLTVQEAIDNGKDATWFTITMGQRDTLEVYDEVKVGYDALAESYPMQGTAKTLEKLNE
ncbi:DUF3221 domain-containing protein [Psychrobacillus lasiicapitis]|uniref:DUF3221 domain-containing protein n=1 Tax=Psychrobacillus lasiicapitis TaxID=1636719 RepID=A0A544T568_9BACI|nr:DUF3221 domain-containing protein [Psychrobacillus lasiicapitis]TQR12579.1 DUF3221 domain-containing protein [Psychrobacillus lasiicapitis]GGA39280.1 hypothetical protein GCM10011384_31060 [Psychrobacillus lasiicapitis]